MSTRWRMGIVNKDGSIDHIYVHSDGYPSYALKTLKNHYNDEKLVRQTIAAGGRSFLHKDPSKNHQYLYSNRKDDPDSKPSHARNKEEYYRQFHGDEEHSYLFYPSQKLGIKGGHWEHEGDKSDDPLEESTFARYKRVLKESDIHSQAHRLLDKMQEVMHNNEVAIELARGFGNKLFDRRIIKVPHPTHWVTEIRSYTKGIMGKASVAPVDVKIIRTPKKNPHLEESFLNEGRRRYRQAPPMTPEELDAQELVIKKKANPSRKGQGKGRPSPFKGVKMGPNVNFVNADKSKKPSKNTISSDQTPISSETLNNLQQIYNSTKFGTNRKK